MYIHLFIHIQIYTNLSLYIQLNKYIYIYVFFVYMHIYRYTHARTCMTVYSYVCMRMHICTYMHMCAGTRPNPEKTPPKNQENRGFSGFRGSGPPYSPLVVLALKGCGQKFNNPKQRLLPVVSVVSVVFVHRAHSL